MEAKVLIVEDERILAIGMKRKLENVGYTVIGIACSGEEAIENAKETNPDLILMDIVLKGEMDGIEAAQQIINLYNIPVIYLTAYADEEILERAMVTEPYGYLLKPFNINELKANIKMALYKHKLETERKESMKNRIMEDYYQFMIYGMDESKYYSEMDIRNILLKTFEESFEEKMKPEFEKELKNNGLDIFDDDTVTLFEAYLSWISKLFTSFGIKNKIRSENDSWYLEFFNCSWSEYSFKNPIFCINCNAMISCSFRWMNIQGDIRRISSIAGNSSKCSFKFYSTP
ncbi:methanogen output domain 1-containing protein [Methanobacterium sp.]|uniref:methanogen output domain 1-containing protein n=1 Tax=Methanobacterium sp. TaxID=2164 RepID=UPI003C70918F